MTTNSRAEDFVEELQKCLQKEDFTECRLEFAKGEGPSGGFSADTHLAQLKRVRKNGETESIQVFIKCGKEGDVTRGVLDVSEAYAREMYMYSDVFPALKAFLAQKGASLRLDYIPECYGAASAKNIPTIVLENLQLKGYRLHDPFYPMNLDHIKLVYENYAKLHATSFAFKEQKPEKYGKVTKRLTRFGDEFWTDEAYDKRYEEHTEKTLKLFSELGHSELMKKWKKYLSKGSLNIFKEALNYQVEEKALIQRDCWNNNFLFMYKDDSTSPVHVKLLDFQLSQTHTPVVDLAAFFYLTCSSISVTHFPELIEHYYVKFSSYMRELGSDPEKTFPMSTLRRHWRDYSIYPCLQAWNILHVLLGEKFGEVKLEDLDHPADFLFPKNCKIKDMDLYTDRVVSAIRHYCDYQEKYSTY